MHENDVIRHDCQFKYVKNNQHIWYDCYRAKDREENLIVLSEDGKDLLGCNTTDGILIIPEGVETIKRDSLKESYPIRQIIIPKSLKFIDDFAFNGTDSILQFVIHPQNEHFAVKDGILYNKEFTKLFKVPHLISNSINIPSSVTCIGSHAFAHCNLLYSLIIPDHVTRIGGYAFYECNRLEEIVLPPKIEDLGKGTFEGCKNLCKIKLPAALINIGDYCFSDCTSLKDIILPPKTEILEERVFYNCENLESVYLNESLELLDWSCFEGCTSLNSFYGDNCKNFSVIDGILYDQKVTRLIKVPQNIHHNHIQIPDGVKAICQHAFEGCKFISEVTMPASLIAIGEYAFSDASNIDKLCLPNRIRFIGNGAFEDCNSLRIISLPWNVRRINPYTFSGCISDFTVPNHIKRIAHTACSGCKSLKTVHIPKSVNEIGVRAFDECKQLESVSIEADIKELPGMTPRAVEILLRLAVEMIMAVSLTREVRKSRKQAWGWGAGPESRSFRGKLYFETKPRVYFETRPAAMQRETSFNLKTNKN